MYTAITKDTAYWTLINNPYFITECNYRGKCYKAGYNLKEGCYRKQCKVDAERRIAYMNIVDGGKTKMYTTD